MFLVVDDNSRANEPADAEEEVEQLDPEVLPHADEQLEHAEVAEDVHHAACGSGDQHGHCQVDEPEAKRADYQRTPAYHDKKGEEAVIGEVLGEERDRGSADDVPACPGEEDEAEVGLILAGDPAEVDDDGANRSDCAAVDGEHQRIGGEVDVFEFYHNN